MKESTGALETEFDPECRSDARVGRLIVLVCPNSEIGREV